MTYCVSDHGSYSSSNLVDRLGCKRRSLEPVCASLRDLKFFKHVRICLKNLAFWMAVYYWRHVLAVGIEKLVDLIRNSFRAPVCDALSRIYKALEQPLFGGGPFWRSVSKDGLKTLGNGNVSAIRIEAYSTVHEVGHVIGSG